MTCPSCDGAKTVMALVNYGGKKGCVAERITCITCDGAGEITEDKQREMEERDRIRRERVERNETMRDAANRLGMTLMAYCDYEMGRASDEPLRAR